MNRCDYCRYKNSWDCEDGWDRVRNDKICDDFVLEFIFLSKKQQKQIQVKMRRTERLDYFYDELKKMHKVYWPDWRFGQLCSNFFGWLVNEKKVNMFFQEESEMLDYFREYSKDNSFLRRSFDLDPAGEIND